VEAVLDQLIGIRVAKTPHHSAAAAAAGYDGGFC